MAETSEQYQARLLAELQGKNIAHYQVMLNAWVQTRMEHDKTLVTLSSAAIALLITIATTVGARSIFELILFVAALLGFLASIWTALNVYRLNSKIIESAIRNDGSPAPSLAPHDFRARIFFMIGAVCFCAIGLTAAFNKFTDMRGNIMAKDEIKTQVQTGNSLTKSLDGIQNLKPSAPNQEVISKPVSSTPPPASSQTQTTTNKK